MNSIANELVTRGWTQGHVHDDQGRVCLWGALGFACGWQPDHMETTEPARVADLDSFRSGKAAVCEAIDEVWGGEWPYDIGAFNDDSETDYDTVLRVAKLADELLGL